MERCGAFVKRRRSREERRDDLNGVGGILDTSFVWEVLYTL
jgi:hypothetical protein